MPVTDTSWAGRRCLVTGGHGWLGRFLVAALQQAGAQVTVLDLAVPSASGAAGIETIVADLAAGAPDLAAASFDHVFHLAGKAHTVPRTVTEEETFYRVNRDGTSHLLAALAGTPPPQSLLLVSTVAVYGLARGDRISEDHPRRATDPYGESKRQAEDLVFDWCERQGARPVVVRPPLVAGPGAPGNLGAMVAALRRGRYLRIGDGMARRSLVCADDLCRGLLALTLRGEGAYHLTDGRHPALRELEEALAAALGRGPVRAIPRAVARLAALAGDLLENTLRRDFPLNSQRLAKLTTTLTFDDGRARKTIAWRPTAVTQRARWIVGGDAAGASQE